MRYAIVMSLLVCLTFVTGCTSLDKLGTFQNDDNVQVVTKQNDDMNKQLATDGKLDPTVKQSRDVRNEEARKLARKMAKASGNTTLPDDWNSSAPVAEPPK